MKDSLTTIITSDTDIQQHLETVKQFFGTKATVDLTCTKELTVKDLEFLKELEELEREVDRPTQRQIEPISGDLPHGVFEAGRLVAAFAEWHDAEAFVQELEYQARADQ